MTTELKKPVEKVKRYYDYNECRDYLQKKYGYDERNYGKKAKNKFGHGKDFWGSFVILMAPNIENGSYFQMSNEWLIGSEDWQKEILEHYLSEFGTGENRIIEFYAIW
jgi:hypothetical protein